MGHIIWAALQPSVTDFDGIWPVPQDTTPDWVQVTSTHNFRSQLRSSHGSGAGYEPYHIAIYDMVAQLCTEYIF